MSDVPHKLRPSGLGSGIDKDRPDYTVVTGEWNVGRIYETRGGPDSLRWKRRGWEDSADYSSLFGGRSRIVPRVTL